MTWRSATASPDPTADNAAHERVDPLPPAESTRHLVPLVERAMAPDRRGALSVLYEIRKAQGRAQAAEALIRRIVALDPNNLVATNELSLILLGEGSLAEAEIHARNAIRIAFRCTKERKRRCNTPRRSVVAGRDCVRPIKPTRLPSC